VKILLVEDEDRIASFVERGLAADGHSSERATTVAEAAMAIELGTYDLVVLDLLLPDGHGRDVLERVRKTDPGVPVLVLSAVGDVDDKVDILDMGANDYMTKPFAFREFAARIRALTRQESSRSDALEVGDLSLDLHTRVAQRGDRRTDLPPREFALLEYLMRHPGQVLGRQQILDAVWGSAFITESNVVDVYISYLRRRLDEPGEPSAIETVRGAGYRVRR
jgi:two-component system OmpR family response regulator